MASACASQAGERGRSKRALDEPDLSAEPDLKRGRDLRFCKWAWFEVWFRIFYSARGRSGGRQRRTLDWWLYLKTELPDDPVRIARQSNWGQGQLAKVSTLTRNENQADHETGRPALYDNAIDTDYTHSIGIQKGQI
ncbi:hypothetical protein HMPREF2791_00460 [Corynebacterium sp. HMSC034A01]|nr:hypothetical protein HMPREF2791_00460 [Corynebacterium sp. HMSC034A01]